jgi:hypothetical protein
MRHCAANRKRRFSALPNVGPYIYDVKISGFTRGSIYDINRLRVKVRIRIVLPEVIKMLAPNVGNGVNDKVT